MRLPKSKSSMSTSTSLSRMALKPGPLRRHFPKESKTTSEESAQGRYPSTIGGPRSPTSHQKKEAWMGRTHNAKKRWQMDEACARMVSHRREATRWKTTDEMLGVHDADGFQLKSNGSKNLSAIKSPSDDSNVQSSDIITVIEKCPMSPIAADEVRNRSNSIESDADVPYSLCSEDEAEPMTMIDKSMKVSQSAEQLSSPKEEQKPKTVVVNVELDAKAKREEPTVDVNTTVKERIAALQSAVAKKQIPSAKLNEKDGVLVLNRTEELEQSILKVKPATNATNSDGSMRRRQVRFMRGCCVVQ
uniref:Uncharacterized protein n=2 Tax=Caenorhabditis japonica TaxID=281687 RepID=A0A8R1IVT1_CAEJA